MVEWIGSRRRDEGGSLAPDAAAAEPLKVQRRVILGLLVILTAAAWYVLVRQAAGMGMVMGPTMGMGPPLFLALWVVMMIAMMLPSAAPMILAFHRVQEGRRRRGEAFVATWVFVAGYFAVWALSGLAAWLGAAAAEAVADAFMTPPRLVARIGGTLIVLAGLYQLSPLKNVCLAKCRSPLGFIMTSWRDGIGGALRMGVAHGAYCLGCCWLLFVIVFPLGMMNIAALALVTLLILAEKTLPWGQTTVRAGAASLVLYGAVILAVPTALPTFMDMGAMPDAPASQ